MEIKKNQIRLQALEFLRIIMTGVIFLSHCEFLSRYSFGKIYTNFFHNPTLAVDFFFMLSGFGMMLSSLKKGISDSSFRFSYNKISKIYPLYVMSLALALPYYIMFYTEGQLAKLVFKFSFSLTLLQSATGMTRFSHMINGVCWFLSCLFIIYLFSPFLMNLLVKKCTTRKKNRIVLFLIIGFIPFFNKCLIKIESQTVFDDLHYGSPYIRVFYVIVGMLLAKEYIFRQAKNMPINLFWSDFGEVFVTILSILWFFLRNTMVMFFNSIVITVIDVCICSSLLYIFAKQQGIISKIIIKSSILKISSYVMYIYLLHYPIRNYVDLFFKDHSDMFGITTGILEAIIILIITIVVSFIIYTILSKAMKRKIKYNNMNR